MSRHEEDDGDAFMGKISAMSQQATFQTFIDQPLFRSGVDGWGGEYEVSLLQELDDEDEEVRNRTHS